MSVRPKIGITMRLELETRRFYLGRDYSEAVEAFGADPLHLALIPRREFIASVLAGLDGVLLPGSDTDVDPEHYGEEPHAQLGRVVPEKDDTERLVIQEAEKLGLPILAICYGMQALNVARGGTLVQDIESQVEGNIKHQQGLPLARNSHSLRVAEDGVLAGAVRELGAARNVRVNSHHHQSVGKVGRDLTAVAWAADSVIECIEDSRSGRFALGVQWHPELSWSTDPLSHSVFEIFTEQCRNRSAKRNIVNIKNGNSESAPEAVVDALR